MRFTVVFGIGVILKMNIYLTIQDVLKEHPSAYDFLRLKGLYVDAQSEAAGMLTLKSALQYKKIDEALFLREWIMFIEDQGILGGYNQKECDVWARIPCMVQLPMQNKLELIAKKNRSDITCDVALVEFGEEWLNELFAQKRPPIIVGAGVEGMVKNEVLGKQYINPVHEKYNADFAGFEDPKGIMRMMSCVPLVFVVDKNKIIRKSTSFKLGGSFAGRIQGKHLLCR